METPYGLDVTDTRQRTLRLSGKADHTHTEQSDDHRATCPLAAQGYCSELHRDSLLLTKLFWDNYFYIPSMLHDGQNRLVVQSPATANDSYHCLLKRNSMLQDGMVGGLRI